MPGFTPEMRQRSIEARRRKAEERKLQREQMASITPESPVAFDYEHAPLSMAIERAGQLKHEYEMAWAIIEKRRNPVGNHAWTCWTQQHLDLVPANLKYQGQPIRSQCLKGGDGFSRLPKFIDDGNFEIVAGVKTRRSIYCCNFLCYQVYQKFRVTPPTMPPLNLKEPAAPNKGV